MEGSIFTLEFSRYSVKFFQTLLDHWALPVHTSVTLPVLKDTRGWRVDGAGWGIFFTKYCSVYGKGNNYFRIISLPLSASVMIAPLKVFCVLLFMFCTEFLLLLFLFCFFDLFSCFLSFLCVLFLPLSVSRLSVCVPCLKERLFPSVSIHCYQTLPNCCFYVSRTPFHLTTFSSDLT